VKFFTLSTLATMAFIVTAGCSGQKIETLKDAICCEGGGSNTATRRPGRKNSSA